MKPKHAKKKKPVPRGATNGFVALDDSRKRRVLLADPSPLACRGMHEVINEQSDLVCCGAAGSQVAARAAIAEQKPALIIVSLWLGDGLEFIKTLCVEEPTLLVLVCSQHDEMLFAKRTLRAGATGYIHGNSEIVAFLDAIRSVLAGEIYLSRKMSGVLLRNQVHGRNGDEISIVEMLTDRELQCFLLLGAGVGSRRSAEELKVSIKTVESHRENIKRKLGLGDAAALIQRAVLFAEGHSRTVAAQT